MMEGASASNVENVDVIVFIILFVSFIFIFALMKRFPFEEVAMGSVNVTPADAPQQMMTKVKNPFVLQLKDAAHSNISDGISIEFTSQVPCWVKAFWGVDINDIYPLIYSAWVDFADRFSSNNFLHGSHCIQEELFEPDPVSNKCITFRPDFESSQTGDGFSLGKPPRDKYPLVLIVVDANSLEMNAEDLIQFQQVTTCITICHVSDTHCPGESHIISQFVRTPAGRPYDLKPLFVSDEDRGSAASDYDIHATSSPSQHQAAEDSPSASQTICVVCQTEAVTRAILPCRHAALCDLCFSRMSLCPMCRGPISAFFSLTGKDNSNDSDSE